MHTHDRQHEATATAAQAVAAPVPLSALPPPIQRVDKIRRDYNTWVVNETLEDYALRFTARSFRKWSEFRVANTAFGAISFLLLEAIGGSIFVNYGFTNTVASILFASLVIFLTALPISWYGARYGVDMDLLTRGAGFGYIGSTITSLIYASFTFIFFALEATIMALALKAGLDWPMAVCYLVSALVVIPLVTHGITLISRIQAWTQPLWLVLMALPFVFVALRAPELVRELPSYAGTAGGAHGFNLLLFGAATSVMLSMVTQVGEQIDFLRFLPERGAHNRKRWLAGVLAAGPGWIVLGALRMLGGALLAYVAIRAAVPPEHALEPGQMYLVGFRYVFESPALALFVTTVFVCMSQIKINMTNAYAGSLAWSNFFARVTHSHPGRVVWVVFNVGIALILMQLDVFSALERVLGLYSNVAISWVGALVADLVVNKPLGLSPKGIEFRRAHLYAINPVGVGAMLIASALSIAAFAGLLGSLAQAFSSFVALATAFVSAPLIAWATGGRYYIAREPEAAFTQGGTQTQTRVRCSICEKSYEGEDMAMCPAYRGPICSLCCSLDARCHDACKPSGGLGDQLMASLARLLPPALSKHLDSRLGRYVLLTSFTMVVIAIGLSLIYLQEALLLKDATPQLLDGVRSVLWKLYGVAAAVCAVGCWWLVLTAESRRVAQQETDRQTRLLMQEIEAHRRTDAALQTAKLAAEKANQAKSRYVTGISHELRTPLNSILGYAQILESDPSIPPHRRNALQVIRRSGEHLVSLIDGLLDLAKIEAGKLTLEPEEVHFPEFIAQLAGMLRLQAGAKGIDFIYETDGKLPAVVRADRKRLNQILLNILGNAVKFTERGSVRLKLRHRNDSAMFEITDTGVGISAEDLERIFQPFERGRYGASGDSNGTGLGLTIAQMLTRLMGGELSCTSRLGEGSLFQVKLFLPEVREPRPVHAAPTLDLAGYAGPRRRVLLVDNESVDRQLLANVLQPLGFEVSEAASGIEALQLAPHVRPDLVLLDINMPGIDGWDTARLMRARDPRRLPILIVSADAFERHRGADVGISPEDFFVKPVNVAALLDRIRAKLDLAWIARGAVNYVPPQATEAPALSTLSPLPAALLLRLRELGELGHVRGLLEALDAMQRELPALAPALSRLRADAEAFRLGDFLRTLDQLSHEQADAS